MVAPRGWDAAPGRLEGFLNRQLLPPDVRVWNVSRAPPPAAKNLAVRGEWHAMYNAGAVHTCVGVCVPVGLCDGSASMSRVATVASTTDWTTPPRPSTETQTLHTTVGKLYTYRFSTRQVADPLERRTRAHVPPRAKEPTLDVEKLAALAPMFEGTHDFQVRSFVLYTCGRPLFVDLSPPYQRWKPLQHP